MIKGFALSAGLLAAIEHRDLLHRVGQGGQQMLAGEGAIQAHLDQAHLFAGGVKGFHRFVGGFGAGAHHDDDALGFRIAHIIEEPVLTAGACGEFIHGFLHGFRAGLINGINGFASLEENIGVLRRST